MRATSQADHHRHRRRKPERAGTGNDQYTDGNDEPVRQPRLRSKQRPREKGERGNETWEKDSWKVAGNTNVWAPMSADEELGYVYLPFEEATGDYFGRAGIDIEKLLAGYLAKPIVYGPDYPRQQLSDINTDLFPKDEFDLSAP